MIARCEPLSIRRFYSHRGHKNQAYGHWMINPETLMLFNFSGHREGCFAGIGEMDGSFILCEEKAGSSFTFKPEKHESFTNTGQTHPLNYRISSRKIKPGRYEYYWEGSVKDGSGRQRMYRSEIGLWHQESSETFQACIQEERKPNGNVIYYEYEDFNHKAKTTSHYKNLSTYYILRSISAYSSKGVSLGSIQLRYPDEVKGDKKERRYIHRVEITGSDKRTAKLVNRVREVAPKKKHGKPWDYVVIPAVMDVVLAPRRKDARDCLSF